MKQILSYTLYTLLIASLIFSVVLFLFEPQEVKPLLAKANTIVTEYQDKQAENHITCTRYTDAQGNTVFIDPTKRELKYIVKKYPQAKIVDTTEATQLRSGITEAYIKTGEPVQLPIQDDWWLTPDSKICMTTKDSILIAIIPNSTITVKGGNGRKIVFYVE